MTTCEVTLRWVSQRSDAPTTRPTAFFPRLRATSTGDRPVIGIESGNKALLTAQALHLPDQELAEACVSRIRRQARRPLHTRTKDIASAEYDRLPHTTIAAAPSIESSFTAISASLAWSSGNAVTFGFRPISLATWR